MRKVVIGGLLVVGIVAAVILGNLTGGAKWTGVDESVVEKFATEAGRPPKPPLINTEQGDLLLFLFLVAGTTGGFIAGYYFRALFPPVSAGTETSLQCGGSRIREKESEKAL